MASRVTLTLAAATPGGQIPRLSSPGAASATPAVITPGPTSTFGIEMAATLPPGTTPSGPTKVDGFLIDRSSAGFAEERRAIADSFESNVLERPFSPNTMDYQPEIDILRAEISLEGEWIYVSITLEGVPPAGKRIWYSVEVDPDLQGQGEWLIVSDTPTTYQWSPAGVRVYQDVNRDVGGLHPLAADVPPQPGDGYEFLAFEDGVGSIPNAAWARLSPDGRPRVQIAFRPAVIGGARQFLWGVWADAGVRQAAWFDYHDHFTFPAAGSALASSPYYPVKALASVDNTCRWVLGLRPSTTYPGLCRFEVPTPIPSQTATPVPPTPTP